MAILSTSGLAMAFSLAPHAAGASREVICECGPTRTSKGLGEVGRRRLLPLLAVSVAPTLPESGGSRKALLEEYLERSRKNKEKYDKERLDDYYRKNYGDYFGAIEGSVGGKEDELASQTEKTIRPNK